MSVTKGTIGTVRSNHGKYAYDYVIKPDGNLGQMNDRTLDTHPYGIVQYKDSKDVLHTLPDTKWLLSYVYTPDSGKTYRNVFKEIDFSEPKADKFTVMNKFGVDYTPVKKAQMATTVAKKPTTTPVKKSAVTVATKKPATTPVKKAVVAKQPNLVLRVGDYLVTYSMPGKVQINKVYKPLKPASTNATQKNTVTTAAIPTTKKPTTVVKKKQSTAKTTSSQLSAIQQAANAVAKVTSTIGNVFSGQNNGSVVPTQSVVPNVGNVLDSPISSQSVADISHGIASYEQVASNAISQVQTAINAVSSIGANTGVATSTGHITGVETVQTGGYSNPEIQAAIDSVSSAANDALDNSPESVAVSDPNVPGKSWEDLFQSSFGENTPLVLLAGGALLLMVYFR